MRTFLIQCIYRLGINESESSVNNDDTMLEFGTKDIRHQNKDSVNYPKSDVDRGSFNSNGDEYLIGIYFCFYIIV